jgi:hypothetical protein
MKELVQYDEAISFDSVSVTNAQYEPHAEAVFYGDEIANFISSPVSQVNPDDYLCESLALPEAVYIV